MFGAALGGKLLAMADAARNRSEVIILGSGVRGIECKENQEGTEPGAGAGNEKPPWRRPPAGSVDLRSTFLRVRLGEPLRAVA
jgi:hypothetical protein